MSSITNNSLPANEVSAFEQTEKKWWNKTIEKKGKKAAVETIEYLMKYTDWTKDTQRITSLNQAFLILEGKQLKKETKKELDELKNRYKIVLAKDEPTALSLINAPTKNKEKVNLLTDLITEAKWDENPGQRAAIDKGMQQLNTQTLKPKVRKKLEIAKTVDAGIQRLNTIEAQGPAAAPIQAAHPTLSTARILHAATCKRLKEISQEWSEKARVKNEIAHAAAAHSKKTTKTLAYNSDNIADCLSAHIPKKPDNKNHVAYAAYDNNMKVHGIALVTFSKKKAQKIDFIGTNPDNLAIVGDEKNIVRGAGSAIITHIAHDILKKKKYKEKTIELCSLSSAKPFYKKLGFKHLKHGDMELKKSKMEALVQAKPATHTMQAKEPSAPESLKA